MKNSVNILGTEYKIIKKKYKEEKAFEEVGITGYCDGIEKEIVYCKIKTHPEFKSEPKEYCKKEEKRIMKHEIVHAFLNESGLAENSDCFNNVAWAKNEEMVDWIALQGEKIYRAWEEVGCL